MRFTRLHLLAALLLGGEGLVSAARRHARRDAVCYFEVAAAGGDTCESLSISWGLSVDLFTKINPGLACPDLVEGKAYCVIGEWTPGDETTTTLTTSITTPSTQSPIDITTTATPINSPTMPGIAPDCDRFYRVQSGDQCDAIASSNSITVDQLRAWNNEINDSCSNLWLDYFICTHVPGAVSPTTTTSGGTAPTVSPIMPGIDPNCDGFYKIQSGDQCDIVASSNGISVAQLRAWNTEINDSCSNLWLGYYICVHIPGATAPSPTTSVPGSSNSPALPGVVPNCDKWYKITSGDTCDSVAAKNKITVAQLRNWNTQIVNPSCDGLLPDHYACVGIPGAATPMPEIVSSCSRFYEVVSGDSCDLIAQKNDITVANFRRWNPFINSACTNVWANSLVCTNAP